MLSKWNNCNETPPDELVEVMDCEGRIGRAMPAIYTFTLVKGQVVKTEPTWEGWLIQADGLDAPSLGEIIAWRRIDTSKNIAFWERLKSFVADVQPGCLMGEEEKAFILAVCDKNLNV